MGWDHSAIPAGGWAPATVSATPEVVWEGSFPESLLVTVEEQDEFMPSEAIVERDTPNVVTSRSVAIEGMEVMPVLLRTFGSVHRTIFNPHSR